MKKSIIAFALCAAFFTSCKKEEVKVQDEHQLEEVQLEEKATYNHKLEWTAYKTPEKLGVKGSFDTITLNNVSETGTIEGDIKGADFKVDTKTVNSNDPLRDGKLVEGFFKLMAGDITGKFIDFKEGKATVEITMNGVSTQKEFLYTSDASSLALMGTIDIINDFDGSSAFNNLHELCKDLHMGKTWTEVDLNVTISKK